MSVSELRHETRRQVEVLAFYRIICYTLVMTKHYMSGMLDAILAAKMKAEKKLQAMGRAHRIRHDAKQKLIGRGKYRLD